MTRTWPRWVPAAVVPAVIAAGALVGSSYASAGVNLPDKTPEQVLAMIGESTVTALSGTLEQSAQLGLPQLPTGGSGGGGSGGGGAGGAAAALELLTGSHTARIYLDGPTNVRAQVMDQLAERDVVRHGDDVWFYASENNTVTHVTLPAEAAGKPGAGQNAAGKDAAVPGEVQTPAQLAQRMLTAIDPSTQVTVGRDTMVAGRSAYDLVLTPKTSGTLVGSVSIAVDSATGLPLSVDIQARGQAKPAFRLAFTHLTLTAPATERFTFTPPPGATVQEQALPSLPTKGAKPGATGPLGRPAMTQPTLSGTGWDAVIVLPAGSALSDLIGSPLFGQLTRTVTGGRLLHTPLVNVLVTGDGRVLAGSVPVERLQAAATGQ